MFEPIKRPTNKKKTNYVLHFHSILLSSICTLLYRCYLCPMPKGYLKDITLLAMISPSYIIFYIFTVYMFTLENKNNTSALLLNIVFIFIFKE